jgi:hypothetical protein
MRFKLDENFDMRLASLVAEGGHDVQTVLAEGRSGQADEAIYRACILERRALLTLDMDFANPLRFPPAPTEGIVVVRPPRPLLPLIRAVLVGAMPRLKAGALTGKLWIVEPGRIRVYEPGDGLAEQGAEAT